MKNVLVPLLSAAGAAIQPSSQSHPNHLQALCPESLCHSQLLSLLLLLASCCFSAPGVVIHPAGQLTVVVQLLNPDRQLLERLHCCRQLMLLLHDQVDLSGLQTHLHKHLSASGAKITTLICCKLCFQAVYKHL